MALPVSASGAASPAVAAAAPSTAVTVAYNVLAADGAGNVSRAAAAARAAGGRVTATNTAVGLLRVTSDRAGFAARVARSSAVEGVAVERVVGRAPAKRAVAGPGDAVEQEGRVRAAAVSRANVKPRPGPKPTAGSDPLDASLWGLRMTRADLSRSVQAGDARVLVGDIDTGMDARQPDIAPNFEAALSRNFTTDMPDIDGPCEFAGCKDPADWDDDGHGTHTAGTIAAAANGFGLSGVAPGVRLVNLRAGQDSGYFFLQPVVDALTYAADNGIDVVNMSFYVDPWLYNCERNPADSPAAQAEQHTIIKAMNRALKYAYHHEVTLVASAGNQHQDLGAPLPDASSPDYPPGAAYPRPIDNATCVTLPTEGPNVIAVSALGPSETKADYSNYGVEQVTVSAPGGYFRDYLGTPAYRTAENQILSTYPVNSLQSVTDTAGNPTPWVDQAGNITPLGAANGVVKSCPAGVTDFRYCGWYAWLQGTSMASPHVAGVAALVVSQYAKGDTVGDFRMRPKEVARVITATAREHACPDPRTVSYEPVGRPAEFTATCAGTPAFNGFYGHGVVDALAAVSLGRGKVRP
nr:S8 family serine peptidase [Motilibacter deserti]